MGKGRCDIRAVLPAGVAEAEQFCMDFRRRTTFLKESSRFIAELILREVLTNAVEHGSGGDRNRQVLCVVRVRPRKLTIAVQDQGDGFDWRLVSGRKEDPLDTRGRGLAILSEFASRVRFNAKGNAVVVVLRLPPDVTADNDMTTQNTDLQYHFTPPGDIVAARVPELRSQLRAILDAGEIRHLVFDLANVRMVDSLGIGLLISVHNTLRQTGRDLSVTHVSEDVFNLFRTLRLHQHFSIAKD